MVIARKGIKCKHRQIQNALKEAHTIDEAYQILEKFGLSNEEACQEAKDWHTVQMMLKTHGKGVYATPCIQAVA